MSVDVKKSLEEQNRLLQQLVPSQQQQMEKMGGKVQALETLIRQRILDSSFSGGGGGGSSGGSGAIAMNSSSFPHAAASPLGASAPLFPGAKSSTSGSSGDSSGGGSGPNIASTKSYCAWACRSSTSRQRWKTTAWTDRFSCVVVVVVVVVFNNTKCAQWRRLYSLPRLGSDTDSLKKKPPGSGDSSSSSSSSSSASSAAAAATVAKSSGAASKAGGSVRRAVVLGRDEAGVEGQPDAREGKARCWMCSS